MPRACQALLDEEQWEAMAPLERDVLTGLVLGGVRVPKLASLYQPDLTDRVAASDNGVALFLGVNGAPRDRSAALDLWATASGAFEPNSVLYLALVAKYEEQDDRKALELFQRAATLGQMEAAMWAGRMLGESNPKSAKAILEGGGKHYGCVGELGLLHFRASEWKEAFPKLRDAYEHGELHLGPTVAECYRWGRGVGRDYDQAVKLWKLHADSANVCLQLGRMCLAGKGVKKASTKRARRWFVKAVEFGSIKALYPAGMLLVLEGEEERGEQLIRDSGVDGEVYFSDKERALEAFKNFPFEESKLCQSCHQTSEKMLRCGKCKLASYCSPECQKHHWSVHKLNCAMLAAGK